LNAPVFLPWKGHQVLPTHAAFAGGEKLPTRAKTLTPDQKARLYRYVGERDHTARNFAIFLLSFECGLRAKEIACLRWKRNVLDAGGRVASEIFITRDVTKGAKRSNTKERRIPIEDYTRYVLQWLFDNSKKGTEFVIYPLEVHHTGPRPSISSERVQPNTIAQYIRRVYDYIGFVGCSSHTGRRTFGTTLARKANSVGASIVDVQQLLGHANLQSTIPYLDVHESHVRLVQVLD
jgi:integrase/recombinase XerD